jgi:hypothetical protein
VVKGANSLPLVYPTNSVHPPVVRSLLFAALLVGCGYPDYRYLDEDSGVNPGEDTSVELDSATTEETDPDACAKPNGCGGCNDLGIRGTRCEPCGQWTCDGTKVVCTAASPAPGSICGMCGKGVLACTALGTTACMPEDDRVTYDDSKFDIRDEKVTVLDRTNEVLITFKSIRSMAYVDVSTVLKRIPYACAHITALPHPDSACSDCKAAAGGGFDCTVPAPAGGFITMTLYTGMPPALVPLAMASGPATTALDTKADWVTIPFSTPVSARPPGTQLSIGITTDSTSFAFEVYGGKGAVPPPPADTKWWQRSLKPSGSWLEQVANDVAHVLRGKACAP